MTVYSAATVFPELPVRRETDVDAALPADALVLLVAVLAAAVAWAWWRNRGSNGSWSWRRALRLPEASVRLRLVASMRLDARASVHVLEWEGAQLLVARGEQAVTLLAERPIAPPDRSPPSGERAG